MRCIMEKMGILLSDWPSKFFKNVKRFLVRLYESTGRAIAVTPASASVSASALALASALLKC